MRILDHPCVTKLIEICLPKDPETFEHVYVVMELCESDLSSILKKEIKLEIKHI